MHTACTQYAHKKTSGSIIVCRDVHRPFMGHVLKMKKVYLLMQHIYSSHIVSKLVTVPLEGMIDIGNRGRSADY